MKKEFVLVFGIFLLSGVLGAISISNTDESYNLGDRLYVSLEGVRGLDSGNLNIDLVCGGVATNLVKLSARAFSSDEDSSYSIPYKILDRSDLEVENLSDIVGICQVVVSVGESVVSSDSFVVSNDVDLDVSLSQSSYNPGEEVVISVDAVKKNGENLNGFLSVSGVGGFDVAVVDGVGSGSFVVPDTLEAGVYVLNFSVWDVDSDGVLNSGSVCYSFDVAQVASSLVLSLGDDAVNPGESLDIGVEVYDQSGVGMSGVVGLQILSPEGEGIDASLNAGDVGSFDFDSNASAGVWKIVALFGELSEVVEFEVAQLQKVEFELSEDILTIYNVGNVLYNRSIDIDIGDDVMTLDLNIDVGEVRKFNLDAPNGEYEIVVDDGESSLSKSVLLTGNAISVEDLSDLSILKSYSLIWIFVVLVLICAGVVFFVKSKKSKVLGKGSLKDKFLKFLPKKFRGHVGESMNFTKKSAAVNGLDSKHHVAEDKTMVDFTKKAGAVAESSLVLKGEKLGSAVISISVKNYADLSDEGKVALQKIVSSNRGKGLVDWRGDYVFVVFSPLITRTYKNEGLAVGCALKIVEALDVYNKKFRSKVEFGIGVHMGELIASKEGDKLKYTGIGNTVSFAKRMSDSDSGRVVVSEDVKKKLGRDLKVSKGKDISEKLTFVVESVRDGANDAAKLKDLLKRSNS